VDILNSGGSIVDGTTAKLSSNDNDQTSAAIYEYSVWANPGDELTFVPRDSRYINLVVFLITVSSRLSGGLRFLQYLIHVSMYMWTVSITFSLLLEAAFGFCFPPPPHTHFINLFIVLVCKLSSF